MVVSRANVLAVATSVQRGRVRPDLALGVSTAFAEIELSFRTRLSALSLDINPQAIDK